MNTIFGFLARKTRTLLGAALFAAAAGAFAADAPAIAPDPIEGKWWGSAGFPTDRIELGFDFRRAADGKLHAYLYEPVVNYVDLDMQGPVERDGERYVIANGVVLSLVSKNGTLEGTFFPLQAPIELRRTDRLPTAEPLPDLPAGPGPKWIAKLGGAVYAPVEVRDGVAYVGTTGGHMHAIRTSDGSYVWMFAAGRPIYGGALATDDALFFACDNGYLFKLDRKTGKEIWRYDLGDERSPRMLEHQVLDKIGIGEFDWDTRAPRPLLVAGILYLGAGDGGFHAVDAATGKRVWRFQGKGALRNDATLDGTRLLFGSMGDVVYAVERATGTEVWEKDTRGPLSGGQLVIGGRLIVGTRNGLLAALDPATGKVLWRMILWGSSVESTPVAGDGDLFYIGSSDMRRIQLIDSKDARVLWRTDIYGCAWPRPLVTAKRVFASAVGTDPYAEMRHLGSFSALDRTTGRILWRWPMPPWPGDYVNGFAAPPTTDGATVLVGGLDGTLYAFPAE